MYKCRTDEPGFHFDDERDPVEKIEFEDARREFLSDVREDDQLSVLPETPCVGVCNTLYVDNCQGCGRTLLEDANWSVMTPDEKREVWARILKQGWKPQTGIAR